MRLKYRSISDNLFLLIMIFILAVIGLLMLYPLIYVVSCSFSSPAAVMTGRVLLWPVEPTLMGYKAVFSNNKVIMGYYHTLIYMSLGAVLCVAMNLMAAYPLSRTDFKGRNIIMIFFAVTMFFNGGMIPTYLLIHNLKMMNTIWALVLPGAVNVWFIIIIRTFYQSNISLELLEAAQIDGCTNRWFFFRCVIPLSKTVIAVMILFSAVGYWNSYMAPLLYLNDTNKYPLQLVLREILIRTDNKQEMMTYMEDITSAEIRKRLEYLLKYGIIVVSSVPVLIAYPFVQKHFVKGVMIGSLKG